jgi:hypothetical protein
LSASLVRIRACTILTLLLDGGVAVWRIYTFLIAARALKSFPLLGILEKLVAGDEPNNLPKWASRIMSFIASVSMAVKESRMKSLLSQLM